MKKNNENVLMRVSTLTLMRVRENVRVRVESES